MNSVLWEGDISLSNDLSSQDYGMDFNKPVLGTIEIPPAHSPLNSPYLLEFFNSIDTNSFLMIFIFNIC